jgi:hypothetical protein
MRPRLLATNFPKVAMVRALNFRKCGTSETKAKDDFYSFKTFKKVPTRIPVSSFAEVDLLKDVLRPSNDPSPAGRGDRSDPVVELRSAKSGLKLAFDTNR